MRLGPGPDPRDPRRPPVIHRRRVLGRVLQLLGIWLVNGWLVNKGGRSARRAYMFILDLTEHGRIEKREATKFKEYIRGGAHPWGAALVPRRMPRLSEIVADTRPHPRIVARGSPCETSRQKIKITNSLLNPPPPLSQETGVSLFVVRFHLVSKISTYKIKTSKITA